MYPYTSKNNIYRNKPLETEKFIKSNDFNNTHSVNHSQTVGQRGPVLLQDTKLHEILETFINEKVIERSVHTKGYGTFGHFTTYKSMKKYTKAGFLQNIGQKTYTFSRFSLAISTKGTPDTSRNVRGFSTKFYTNEGIFDLLCNHIPVFLVRDSIKFPQAIKALSPSKINNLINPETFWEFIAQNPEATHFLTWLYSDLGTIDNLRYMRTYGVNTYVWKNMNGTRHYVKYHWIPCLGQKCIDKKTSVYLAGENPDIAGKDLYDTLANKKTVEYDLCVQLMNIDDENNLPFDVLDDTKLWDENQYPLIFVGRLTLEKNPDDYFKQVELAAFSPSNLVEGIELSADKMLQGRSFIYWDAQRRRIGSDFRDKKINCMENWNPNDIITSGEGEYVEGMQIRAEIKKTDNFTQAGQHYNCLSNTEKEHLIDNIASELYIVENNIQNCVLKHLFNASEELSNGVYERMKYYSNNNN